MAAKRYKVPPMATAHWYNMKYQLLTRLVLPWDAFDGLGRIGIMRGYPDLGHTIRVAVQSFLEQNAGILIGVDKTWIQRLAQLSQLTTIDGSKPDLAGLENVKALHDMYDKINPEINSLNKP